MHGYYSPLLMYVLVDKTLVEDWCVHSGHPQASAAQNLLEAIVQHWHPSASVLLMLLSDDVHIAIPERLALKLQRVRD